ncbi:MAG: HAD hydrolase-like protein, partial [Candidatus Omnitrophota bacterium]
SMGFKPLPFAFLRALKEIDAKPEETAMIGDQLFMDILGGNLVNLYTIYVKPLTPETFLPRIWMRQAEDWVIGRFDTPTVTE